LPPHQWWTAPRGVAGHGTGSLHRPTPPAYQSMQTCRSSRWRRISAAQADAGDRLAWRWSWRPWRPVRLNVVNRPEGTQGFSRLPTRGMVAQTAGWLGRDRRAVEGGGMNAECAGDLADGFAFLERPLRKPLLIGIHFLWASKANTTLLCVCATGTGTCRCARTSNAIRENCADFCARNVSITRGV
jgi:hypothetical protein